MTVDKLVKKFLAS